QQHRIGDVQHDIDSVITRRVQAANKVIQIKRKESELTQMKRIEEICPTRRIRHIAVARDERVVEVKWVGERCAEQQKTCYNQSSRNFHAIFAGPIICVLRSCTTG